MVFEGRPSLGCHECRRRRIKCDTRRPKCGLCTKAGHDCCYRDVNGLLFRDETSVTISRSGKKHRKSKATSAVVQVCPQRHGGTPVLCLDADEGKTLATRCLTQSCSDVAIHLWVTKYVRHSHVEFLASFCEANPLKGPLHSAVASVAMASFSNEVPWPQLLEMSWMHYSKAIREIQNMIKDPEAARSDDALAAVLLLSSFESLSPDIHSSTKIWTRHIQGALALLNARGGAALATPFGRRAFVQITTSVALDCLQSRTPIPQHLRTMLSAIAAPVVSGPREKIQRLAEDLIDLRACIADGTSVESCQIIRAAEKIDHDACLLERSMLRHPDYCYGIVQTEPVDVDGTRRHIYSSVHANQLWNTLRMHRLIINDIIFSHTSEDSYGFLLLERQRAATRISSMCLEICASLPRFAQGANGQIKEVDSAAAVNFALWPLFTVGCCTHVPCAVREYARNALVELGKRYKNHRAIAAARQLERGEHDEAWMHVNHMY